MSNFNQAISPGMVRLLKVGCAVTVAISWTGTCGSGVGCALAGLLVFAIVSQANRRRG